MVRVPPPGLLPIRWTYTAMIKGELREFSTTFQTKLYHEKTVKSIFFASCI